MAVKTMAPAFLRRGDDDKAFERLYERHVRDVYRYAAGMLGTAADAEDVTQTTFLNAYRAFKSGTRPDKPQSWLIAIAHNVCRQRFRQAQRRPHEVAFDEGVGDGVGDGETTDDLLAPTAEDLRRCLSQLPPNQRAAIVMRELEGGSYAEIAEVLGISVSALETLLFRARRALREQLEEQISCKEAAFAINKQLDGRLSLGERRALRAHLRACAECNSHAHSQRAQRRALKALVLIPLPASVSHWMGPQSAAAATGAAGAAGASGLTAVGVGTTAGAGAGGAASSVVFGGAAAKVAAIVVAGVAVGGGTYEGIARVGLPHASVSSAPAARIHIVPSPSRGEAIASVRTFETPKSVAPFVTSGVGQQGQAQAAASRARVARKHALKRNGRTNLPAQANTISAPAAAPGQIVKAIATSQPHTLRGDQPGHTVVAARSAKSASAQEKKATAQSRRRAETQPVHAVRHDTPTSPRPERKPAEPPGREKLPTTDHTP
jgi:RNA polymerase sigma factor (sigma-70 family)